MVQSGVNYLASNEMIRAAYGSLQGPIVSPVMNELDTKEAESEIERLVNEAGGNPAVINVKTAQLARTFLAQYVPGAIISDSSFPLNGAVIVQWLQTHGLPGYPLIGLSATPFNRLAPALQRFFTQTSAVYFCKDDVSMGDLVPPLIFSRDWVELQMRNEQRRSSS